MRHVRLLDAVAPLLLAVVTMRVLIVFGSTQEGTGGVARALGAALGQSGHAVDVLPAHAVDGLDPWDAVVVGGAHAGRRWSRGSRRFVERHAEELCNMPVWFFTAGTAPAAERGGLEGEAGAFAAEPKVRALMTMVRARGHVSFGGHKELSVWGAIVGGEIPGGRIVGWRDLERVKAWASELAVEIAATALCKVSVPDPSRRASLLLRRLASLLCFLTAANVLGVALNLWESQGERAPWLGEAILGGDPTLLFIQGALALLGVTALANLVAGVLVLRSHRAGETMVMVAGGALALWLLVEVLFFGAGLLVHAMSFGVAFAILCAGWWLRKRRLARVHRRPSRRTREVTIPLDALPRITQPLQPPRVIRRGDYGGDGSRPHLGP